MTNQHTLHPLPNPNPIPSKQEPVTSRNCSDFSPPEPYTGKAVLTQPSLLRRNIILQQQLDMKPIWSLGKSLLCAAQSC